MEKLLTKTDVRKLGIPFSIVDKYLKIADITYNPYNPNRSVKLYKEVDVLNLLESEHISAEISLKLNKATAQTEHCDKRRQNETDIVATLISQIRVIELPHETLVNNAIISAISNGKIGYEDYINTILPRLSERAKNNFISNYIVHNLIEFSPTYCRLRGNWLSTPHKLNSKHIRRYMEAIVLKVTYVYPMCEQYLIDYLNDLSEQRASFNFNKIQNNYNEHQSITNRIQTPKPVTDLFTESAEYEEDISDKLAICRNIMNK